MNGPGAAAGRPALLPWYRAFVTGMAVFNLAVAGLGAWMLRSPPETDLEITAALGRLYLACGLSLAAACAGAAFLPRRPWAWVAGLVLIGIGITSCCLLPAAIPLMIGWIRPEVQTWFGRDIRGRD